MNNMAEIFKDANIGLFSTNLSQKVKVGKSLIALSSGPYLPILSGNYNVIAIETADFEKFMVTGTFQPTIIG